MEDKVVVVPVVPGRRLWSFFGVCDGHGGDYVASYLAKELPDVIKRVALDVEFETGRSSENDEYTTPSILRDVLLRTCSIADKECAATDRMEVQRDEDENGDTTNVICKDSSGSTGLFCIISDKLIAVANVGDSRALLAQWNPTPPLTSSSMESPVRNFSYDNIPRNILIATALSEDHKFTIPEERQRAEVAGATYVHLHCCIHYYQHVFHCFACLSFIRYFHLC